MSEDAPASSSPNFNRLTTSEVVNSLKFAPMEAVRR